MSMTKFKVVGKKPGATSHIAKVGMLKILTNGKTVCGLNAREMESGEIYFWPQQINCEDCLRRVLQ